MTCTCHTERREVSRASCVALAANSRLGFTLPEIFVALAILLVGTTALLGCWNFFNREVADERMRLEEFYDVLSAMESLVFRTLVETCAFPRVVGGFGSLNSRSWQSAFGVGRCGS